MHVYAACYLYPSCVCGTRRAPAACYLNSLLQSIFLCDAFVANLFPFSLDDDSATTTKKTKKSLLFADDNPELLLQLKILFCQMLTTSRSWCSPHRLIASLPPMYQQKQQQDVTEAARYIFEALGGHERGIVRHIYAGVLANKVQCLHCQYISERKETIFDVSFAIPREKAHLAALENGTARPLTVQGLFDSYVHKERLEGDNKYSCDPCGKKRDAEKWVEILSPPSHMFVVLNRFSWDMKSGTKRKERTRVDVESLVSVCGFTYVLYAAIIHRGATANSGHYYAIGRHSEAEDEWRKYDDSVVTKEDDGDTSIAKLARKAGDASPYVLFYRYVGTYAGTLVRPAEQSICMSVTSMSFLVQ
eukprot:GHVU01108864.1.p1 GENE.GHVU01108864.1~~GHVU01108864.1.p1  ORF type:complete len:361 (+),score=63.45 GHVU01108864.1:334-1416(+)